MLLRQFAVFMNAGSYVISPKSFGPALICRRSMARIAPSWTSSSYFFPVRLSTMVSVSAILFRLFVLAVRPRHGFARHAVPAVRPARQILDPTTFAAERTPRGIDRVHPAEHAQWRLARWRPRHRSGQNRFGRRT